VKPSLLALLRCPRPRCGKELRFVSLEKLPLGESHDVVEEGQLACSECAARYGVHDGVPRLASPELEADARATRDAFAFEWARYPGSLPEDEKILLEEAQLPASEFAGKKVLDAGCGMGRYSIVALSFGAEVVGLDLSDSLLRLAAVAPDWPKLHVVQGDLLSVPLKREQFDLVYSHGVLHHTADTHEAFRQVAELVKPGGYLSVWLYGKAGRFKEFRTNPLRADRGFVARHRLLCWFIVGLRHFFSDFVRVFTTRLPMRLTYLFCYLLAFLGAIPLIKYLTFSVHPKFMVRVIENFDWISPPYQWHHTKEELMEWFEEEGFEVVKVLPHGLVPKPGVLGRRKPRVRG
jgi:SAM-dependent methyltransferase